MTRKNKLIHTPEGVRDSYNAECRKKLAVQNKILDTLYLYGYEHIQTPSFEFFDIFSKDRGSVSSQEMFKFFDRDNNTLVLRPDMTPAVARCVAKYFADEEMPLRLCYLERTFKNNSSYQGRLKERAESGAELIGDDSADADAEVIALVIDSLKAAGLEDFQVELGQVAFYRSLLKEAGLEEEVEQELNQLIENKNNFGVEELLKNQEMEPSLKEAFLKMPELFGSIEQIKTARGLTENPDALAAISRLEEVHEILESCGLSSYVSYDLGMISKYQYYTGIIFKAYTYGTGDYIVTGGRYDKLLVQFGKDTPAVGFAIVVDQLMAALSRQNIDTPVTLVNTIVLYEASARGKALALSQLLRKKGMAVQTMKRKEGAVLEAYREMAKRRGLRNILYLKGNGGIVTAMDMVNGSADEIPYSAYGE
ncbi:ATP phosphoribosyltransferase regulatory subunit [Lacrimispora sp. 210928-DFI.3.58]|uniref:ATP phosphoribosyltransferase regulatory subunit n=1 Tax=Lacrimispora sp. 210928-DFI.3.58 TaxID=2883214 RepID=UPI001D068899|nr:ATP phosphoribosyltransferase regulatory subunit [Lacrimispora sp. 210928-DFI.3.58]MCB7317891.1 ATP phosphoribosyltransferase regulatory subunit [Lacrimispora sp. 210928-DFI.3.58]